MPFERQRIIATILGGAIGDVLGGIAERASLNLSDDTQLTLATCEAILASGDVNAKTIANRMLEWFLAGRITGIGSSTLKAFRDLESGTHWALAGARGEYAAGNGAAMRAAPLAFILDPEQPSHRVLIRDVARITHHSDEAYVGALAVVIAVRSAAQRQSWSAEFVGSCLPDTRVRDNIMALAGMNGASLQTVARSIGSSGFVAETVPVALKLAQAITENGFESAIYEMNEIGGDTDTIAAIAGQIAGAELGEAPHLLLRDVPGRETIVSVAEAFATFASAG
jgi:ADP-ribosyl-[dinitrogen reductase] hydrolase